ncbi:hypothetical protein N0V93_008477 [Gnomoniopsis smithogilvyi]|uniref:Manganese lipoxygenase n=1 Tax=Gnomoniopsis smithogilvyi TaxID=1191159 RepID=A0A9W9CUX2_9PEZI|nr:hypothetical protein N0V93_008477 [Gnomoniopsis smithogilvyi]
MRISQLSLNVLLLLGLQGTNGAVIVTPRAQETESAPKLVGRQPSTSYKLPQQDSNGTTRAAALATTQAGFLYGPPIAGGPAYPSGAIGNSTAAADLASLDVELVAERTMAYEDAALATEAFEAAAAVTGGLTTLEAYASLYDNEWKNTLPKGPAPGVLSNYTQDLFFSMERLSVSPYAVSRLNPFSDSLAFEVDDLTAQAISGSTLAELFAAGRLFYIDHSAQASLERTDAYAAACDAYFYIDEASGDFLPLAIRTGVGANLIYTPRDQANDWLLAKMIFNGNDIFFAQFNHLAGTHEVVQIVWMAAIRTLSAEHPVYAILDRLMYQVFAVQPIARDVLFASGEAVDEIFGYTGTAAQQFTDELYNGGKGAFQSNYFLTDLENRGLINSKFGPDLTHFPFYEDALVIHSAIQAFMTSFVDSYYSSDADVLKDSEIQAWGPEANDHAGVYDFPESISTKQELVDILTHMAHLASTAHHAVNTNELASVSMTLPFHPAALSKPLPTTKGNTSVVSYLPSFATCTEQLVINGVFARPLLVDTNRTLVHMFDDADMLALMNEATNTAAALFQTTMEVFSDVVSARTFDSNGLSQGMPFLWQGLDPNVAPFSVTI